MPKDPMPPNEPAIAEIVAAYEQLMHRLAVHRDPAAFEAAVTMSQLRLLVVVATVGEVHQSELVERLGVSMSTISGLVDRLVDHGYVTRRDDPADRRQVVVAVTPAGEAFLDRLRELGANQLRRLLAHLSADDLAVVHRSISLLLDAAAADATDAPATVAADVADAAAVADAPSPAPLIRSLSAHPKGRRRP